MQMLHNNKYIVTPGRTFEFSNKRFVYVFGEAQLAQAQKEPENTRKELGDVMKNKMEEELGQKDSNVDGAMGVVEKAMTDRVGTKVQQLKAWAKELRENGSMARPGGKERVASVFTAVTGADSEGKRAAEATLLDSLAAELLQILETKKTELGKNREKYEEEKGHITKAHAAVIDGKASTDICDQYIKKFNENAEGLTPQTVTPEKLEELKVFGNTVAHNLEIIEAKITALKDSPALSKYQFFKDQLVALESKLADLVPQQRYVYETYLELKGKKTFDTEVFLNALSEKDSAIIVKARETATDEGNWEAYQDVLIQMAEKYNFIPPARVPFQPEKDEQPEEKKDEPKITIDSLSASAQEVMHSNDALIANVQQHLADKIKVPDEMLQGLKAYEKTLRNLAGNEEFDPVKHHAALTVLVEEIQAIHALIEEAEKKNSASSDIQKVSFAETEEKVHPDKQERSVDIAEPLFKADGREIITLDEATLAKIHEPDTLMADVKAKLDAGTDLKAFGAEYNGLRLYDEELFKLRMKFAVDQRYLESVNYSELMKTFDQKINAIQALMDRFTFDVNDLPTQAQYKKWEAEKAKREKAEWKNNKGQI